MGNHPRIDKLPDDGADPAGVDAGAQVFCLCARPPELPPRSWRAAALDAPRMFALVVAPVDNCECGDCGDCTGPDDAAREPRQGDGQSGEVVAWGLSFPQRAVLFLHNPLTGHDDFGLFESPERARRFYSLFGELHLIYV